MHELEKGSANELIIALRDSNFNSFLFIQHEESCFKKLNMLEIGNIFLYPFFSSNNPKRI